MLFLHITKPSTSPFFSLHSGLKTKSNIRVLPLFLLCSPVLCLTLLRIDTTKFWCGCVSYWVRYKAWNLHIILILMWITECWSPFCIWFESLRVDINSYKYPILGAISSLGVPGTF